MDGAASGECGLTARAVALTCCLCMRAGEIGRELFSKSGVRIKVSGCRGIRTPFLVGVSVASETILDLMEWTDLGVHKVRRHTHTPHTHTHR